MKVVTSAKQLQAAVNNGSATHVHLTEHVDLDALTPVQNVNDEDVFFLPTDTLESLTVRTRAIMITCMALLHGTGDTTKCARAACAFKSSASCAL